MFYQVFLRPLIAPNAYGDELEITNYIANRGLGSIESTIDNTDYVVGVFSYTYMSIKLLNYDGRLSGPEFPDSIFTYKRDSSLVIVRFGDYSFEGLINEQATKEDNDIIDLKVISKESIIEKTAIPFGIINNGVLCSEAIRVILDRSPINNILNVKAENIFLDFDFEIDSVDDLFGESTRDGLNRLLALSNSFLFVNKDSEAVVTSRTRINEVKKIFFASHDPIGREPVIIQTLKFNDGTHRAFNAFNISDTTEQDNNFIAEYGYNRGDIDAPFLKSEPTRRSIALNLVNKYKIPKKELIIQVKTSDINDIEIGDSIGVEFSPIKTAPSGQVATSKYGSAKYGSAKYSRVVGTLEIHRSIVWIVYGRKDNPEKFTTELKLREFGFTFDDGVRLNRIGRYSISRYGDAIYTEDTIGFFGFQENLADNKEGFLEFFERGNFIDG